MRQPTALVSFAFLAFATSASSQAKYDKFAVFVTGLDAAAPVAQSLSKMMNNSKPFAAVAKKDDPSKVGVLISCMPRKQAELIACMYVAQYHGAIFKTFMGGGLFVGTSADAVASNFLGSISQDIVERYDSTDTDNLREVLESCLLMTDSKCNVPDPLQKELDAKQLTLGQYLLKKKQ